MSRPGQRLLTLSLVGACALLMLIAVLFEFGVGTGYSWDSSDAETAAATNDNGVDRNAFKLAPQETFSEISERPLFNDDRKPSPYEAPDTAQLPPPPPEVPLNVNLTGVVITHTQPELRMAILHDILKNQSVTLKEGMPLAGDQGSWTLTQIRDRSVTFKNASGETQDVELKVAATNLKGGPAKAGVPAKPGTPGTPAAFGPGPPGGATAAPPPPPNNNPQSQDLQRRIEERRQQMREAAEKMKQKKPDASGQPAQPQL